MGVYINPTDDTDPREKAAKIAAAGEEVSQERFLQHPPGEDDKVGVAIVDNGPFVAAGVAYHPLEAQTFVNGEGGRLVKYYLLPLAEIERMDPRTANRTRELIQNTGAP